MTNVTIEDKLESFDPDAPDAVESVRSLADEYATAQQAVDTEDEISWDDIHDYRTEITSEVHPVICRPEWGLLADLIEEYDSPNSALDESATLAIGGDLVTHLTARAVVNAHFNPDIETPDFALEYLLDCSPEAIDHVWESSHAIGIAINHDAVDLTQVVKERIANDDLIWTTGLVEFSSYADQQATADLITDVTPCQNAKEFTYDHIHHGKASATKAFLYSTVGNMAYLNENPIVIHDVDRWKWSNEFNYTFNLDSSVAEQLRDHIESLGYPEKGDIKWDYDPARDAGDWTLIDLAW